MAVPEKTVCVMGLGYIGLPMASLLGTKGYTVYGVDTVPEVVETINQGHIHIVEPDLDILVRSAVNSGNLRAALEPCEADIFVIAVPTPFKEGHEPDLSYVESAVHRIVPYVRPGNLIVLESTSPVGTTDGIVARILRDAGHDVDDEVYVAHCPERVLPGRILTELVENDRIVGGINEASTDAAAAFYGTFVRGEVFKTDSRTAELTKLVENAYRDVNVAFANELSMICDESGINVWELISLANRHPRVNILQPGPGVGGHCIPVDPWFIVHQAPRLARLIRTAREVNDAKPEWVVRRVKERASKFRHPVIACLGLAFKPDVDDLRNSPAVSIVEALQQAGIGEVLVSEPNIHDHESFTLLPYQEAVSRADIVVLLVDHREFRSLRAADLKEKILIDTRGVVT